jgi:hypothetical protein
MNQSKENQRRFTMKGSKKIEQSCIHLSNLLYDISKGFCMEAAIPIEQVYASSALACEYVKRMQGLDHDSEMIAFYELNPDHRPMMFSDPKAIPKQIFLIRDSKKMRSRLSPLQHELHMFPSSISGPRPRSK